MRCLYLVFVLNKRSGSGDKSTTEIVQQWVNFKMGTRSKPKGRNKVKLGCSTTLSYKTTTSDSQRKNLIKKINLKTSPKYISKDGKVQFPAKSSHTNTMVLAKAKIKHKNN